MIGTLIWLGTIVLMLALIIINPLLAFPFTVLIFFGFIFLALKNWPANRNIERGSSRTDTSR